MRQYIVDLADRVTGQGQKILVLAEDTDDMKNTQEFIDHIVDLEISNPVVISVEEYTGVLDTSKADV